MLGAIAGDIVGSIYEWNNIQTKEFKLFSKKSFFTDDTVMTIATMDAILNNKSFTNAYKEWFRKYPDGGYGSRFLGWASSDDDQPYNSWGNGSAMRVSPVGFYYNDLEIVLAKAKESAEVTHNHAEGIKGAQATAGAIYLARQGKTKTEIKDYITETFKYDLNEPLDSIRTWYKFDESCQKTVPQAIRAFLESEDFEDAIRNAISLGGDSDTLACITGGIAEAYYHGVPETIRQDVYLRIPEEFKELVDKFYQLMGL